MLRFADVVVVDVQCDYRKNELGNVRDGEADMRALEDAFHRIAKYIQPRTLVPQLQPLLLPAGGAARVEHRSGSEQLGIAG
jgi:hypothetical protein